MKTRNRDLDLLYLAERSGLIDRQQRESLEQELQGSGNAAEILHEQANIDRQKIRCLLDYQRRHSVPSSIGNYHIKKEIGRGGMGLVYQAQSKGSQGRLVAIKVLSPKKMGHRIPTARFLREISVAKSIKHPNLVACLDTGMIEGKPYLVLEYMAGGDLANAGPIEEQQALRTIANCACGVQTIADAGWVHRDIKPSNILLTEDGEAKLADFGLAKTTENDTSLALTRQGCFVGTPAYTAPELLGSGEANVHSDIYALGATLYHLLSGSPPYREAEPAAMLRAIRNGKPPRPLPIACSSACSYIIHKCMAPKPEDRYTNAIELAEDCELAIAGEHPLTNQSTSRMIGLCRCWAIRLRKRLRSWLTYSSGSTVTETDISKQ